METGISSSAHSSILGVTLGDAPESEVVWPGFSGLSEVVNAEFGFEVLETAKRVCSICGTSTRLQIMGLEITSSCILSR